jgi:GNAT superfamily N-acetyltransferase
MAVGRLTRLPDDLPRLAAAARAEGFGMLDALAADWASGTQRFHAPGEALFAARDGAGRLVGIGGLTRDPWAAALRMRRFYVHPEARLLGVGRALALAALAEAERNGAGLLRLRAPREAWRFWESLGFRPTPGAEQATHEKRSAAA